MAKTENKLPQFKIEKVTEGKRTQVYIDELSKNHEKRADHNKYDSLLEITNGLAKDKMNTAKRILNILLKDYETNTKKQEETKNGKD